MILAAAAVCATAACGGPNVLGNYGGEKCIYDNLSLRGGGVVLVTMICMDIPGQYRQDGDNVILVAPDSTQSAFTVKGADLVLELVAEPVMVCSRK